MNNELYDNAVAGDSTADTTSNLYDVDYSTTSNITEDVDFLTILTGILPNGNNIYNRNSNEAKEKSQATSDEKAEETQDQNQTETHKKHHLLWRRKQSNETTEKATSKTPQFTPLPCAPKNEDTSGIFDNRDGKIFDSATRLRLHTIIGACLMNGIADSRVSALMHLLQWQENTRLIAIAGTYETPDINEDSPTRKTTTHTPQNNTDTLRRTIWTQLGACGAYDAIVDRVQKDAITSRAKTWKIAAKPQAKENDEFPAPSHIIILALKENPNQDALNKLCEVFTKSGKPICISEIAVGAQKICEEITATLAALAVAPSVTHLPQIIRCDDVLPERALIGDETAVETLYTKVYQSLAPYNPDDPTLQTVDAFLRFGGALDQTSHNLNVHPNTIRYRLRKVAQTTGWDATDPREAYVLQTAITIGRIRDSAR
ncbi:helix-turn-helix domain-containing protein [Gardnerella vaginalis]|uniref:PucR family transcriptional regulator n=1 Tax=Gardnerella vaginalis TaxID=2702 RepID=UPI000C7B3E57|nr:helix-turn-helix domain-containing protein [Gardnerella vaginalis]PKZ45900.1 regulator [Gardnerella vaginalis]